MEITILGGNELIIRYENGTHVVRESYKDYEPVFVGKYEDCVKYCEERWLDYEESIIG